MEGEWMKRGKGEGRGRGREELPPLSQILGFAPSEYWTIVLFFCCSSFVAGLLWSADVPPCVGVYTDLLFHFHFCCLCGRPIRVCSWPTSTGKIGQAILNSLCAYSEYCYRIFNFCKCACSKISVFSCSVCTLLFIYMYVNINAVSVYKHYAITIIVAGENELDFVVQ